MLLNPIKFKILKANKNEVDAELNKIENHVLNAFNSVSPDTISKNGYKLKLIITIIHHKRKSHYQKDY
jgi:hypothetical protein